MKIKHVQIYHLLSGLICFISFLCGLFIFRDAFSLLIESAKDLVTSISYYFREMFGLENNVYPTVRGQRFEPAYLHQIRSTEEGAFFVAFFLEIQSSYCILLPPPLVYIETNLREESFGIAFADSICVNLMVTR
jgi:hypothetical protein